MSDDLMRRVDGSARELRVAWLAMARALRAAGIVAAVLSIAALIVVVVL